MALQVKVQIQGVVFCARVYIGVRDDPFRVCVYPVEVLLFVALPEIEPAQVPVCVFAIHCVPFRV